MSNKNIEFCDGCREHYCSQCVTEKTCIDCAKDMCNDCLEEHADCPKCDNRVCKDCADQHEIDWHHIEEDEEHA